MAITAFLSGSSVLFNRGPGGPLCLVLVFSTASYLQLVGSPTDCTSCAPSYIIVRRPPSSCGRYKSHSFNPSTVNVIFWYSSTGCTYYLHRCISYFDSPAGSVVNIQYRSHTKKYVWTSLNDQREMEKKVFIVFQFSLFLVKYSICMGNLRKIGYYCVNSLWKLSINVTFLKWKNRYGVTPSQKKNP